MAATPEDALRRSLLYRWHQQHGAQFIAENDTTYVADYGEAGAELKRVRHLGMCDLSLLARCGLSGAGSSAWLQAEGYRLPEKPNTSVVHNGNVLARLSDYEYLYVQLAEALLDGDLVSTDWRGDAANRAYPLPRGDSHCLIALSGAVAPELLAKLCAIDLRPDKFQTGSVAQTDVAGVHAVLIREDIGATCGYYLLTAVSTAEYLWECLVDAGLEFDGGAVGITALRELHRERGDIQ